MDVSIWKQLSNCYSLQELHQQINKGRIKNDINNYITNNVSRMLNNRNNDIFLASELQNTKEGIDGIFFSAYRIINIPGDGGDVRNSPLLVFFSVFKSWFYHYMMYLAKSIETKDCDLDYIKTNNLLTLWNNKDTNDPVMNFSKNDPIIDYDRLLFDNKLKEGLKIVIGILNDVFINNEIESLIRHLNHWNLKKDNKRLPEYIKGIKEKQRISERFQLYLDLIDDILFKGDYQINFIFKMFFCMQGILITLNSFIELSKDTANVNLFNILNIEYVSCLKSLETYPDYLKYIVNTFENFFSKDDLSIFETRETTYDLLLILCSILNVKLNISYYPMESERNGVRKERLAFKRIFPAYEMMTRNSVNTVPSPNIKVMLYMNILHGNLFYLYSDKELVEFNLHQKLLKNYSLRELPESLQQKIANSTVLDMVESFVNTLYLMQNLGSITDYNFNFHSQQIYEELRNLFESFDLYARNLVSNLFEENSPYQREFNDIQDNINNYQEFQLEDVVNYFYNTQLPFLEEEDIFNMMLLDKNNVSPPQSHSEKTVIQPQVENLKKHFSAPKDDNLNAFSVSKAYNEGKREQKHFHHSRKENNNSNPQSTIIGETNRFINNVSQYRPSNTPNFNRGSITSDKEPSQPIFNRGINNSISEPRYQQNLLRNRFPAQINNLNVEPKNQQNLNKNRFPQPQINNSVYRQSATQIGNNVENNINPNFNQSFRQGQTQPNPRFVGNNLLINQSTTQSNSIATLQNPKFNQPPLRMDISSSRRYETGNPDSGSYQLLSNQSSMYQNKPKQFIPNQPQFIRKQVENSRIGQNTNNSSFARQGGQQPNLPNNSIMRIPGNNQGNQNTSFYRNNVGNQNTFLGNTSIDNTRNQNSFINRNYNQRPDNYCNTKLNPQQNFNRLQNSIRGNFNNNFNNMNRANQIVPKNTDLQFTFRQPNKND